MGRTMRGVAAMAWVGVAVSCAPLHEPVHEGMTPGEADEIAIAAVRREEGKPGLTVTAFDTMPTRAGYTVYLQQRTSSTTARHWKVRVGADKSAEVLPAEADESTPRRMEADPAALQGNQKTVTP